MCVFWSRSDVWESASASQRRRTQIARQKLGRSLSLAHTLPYPILNQQADSAQQHTVAAQVFFVFVVVAGSARKSHTHTSDFTSWIFLIFTRGKSRGCLARRRQATSRRLIKRYTLHWLEHQLPGRHNSYSRDKLTSGWGWMGWWRELCGLSTLVYNR